MYTPGIKELMTDLNCSHTVAILPMSLFVIDYGIGPMFFSPLSENATIGRTPVYIITLFIFFILQIIIAIIAFYSYPNPMERLFFIEEH